MNTRKEENSLCYLVFDREIEEYEAEQEHKAWELEQNMHYESYYKRFDEDNLQNEENYSYMDLGNWC